MGSGLKGYMLTSWIWSTLRHHADAPIASIGCCTGQPHLRMHQSMVCSWSASDVDAQSAPTLTLVKFGQGEPQKRHRITPELHKNASLTTIDKLIRYLAAPIPALTCTPLCCR